MNVLGHDYVSEDAEMKTTARLFEAAEEKIGLGGVEQAHPAVATESEKVGLSR